MGERLDPKAFSSFAVVNGYRTTICILADFSVIIACAAFSTMLESWFLYLLVIPFIGARQHALIILIHEAVHRGLYTSKRVNDSVGTFLSALFFFSFTAYRKSHSGHHRYLNTRQDPDWARYNETATDPSSQYHFPMPASKFFRLILGDLAGLNILQLISNSLRYRKPAGVENKFGQAYHFGFVLSVAVVIAYIVGLKAYLMFWLLPAITWLKMNLRLRLISEHFYIKGTDGTRTMIINSIERFFIWPHNISFHVCHHLYPSVRQRFLPEANRWLQASISNNYAHTNTHGLRGLLSEVLDSNKRGQ